MNCDKFLKLVDAYADGELCDSDLQQCAEHIAHCASCAECYNVTLAIKEVAAEAVEPPEGFEARILDAVKQSKNVTEVPRRRFYPMPVTLISAAVIALFIGLSGGRLETLIGLAGSDSAPKVAENVQAEEKPRIGDTVISAPRGEQLQNPPVEEKEIIDKKVKPRESAKKPKNGGKIAEKPKPPAQKAEEIEPDKKPSEPSEPSEQSDISANGAKILPPDAQNERDAQEKALFEEFAQVVSVKLESGESADIAVAAGLEKRHETVEKFYFVGSGKAVAALTYKNLTPEDKAAAAKAVESILVVLDK